jgi:hypothetical protein
VEDFESDTPDAEWDLDAAIQVQASILHLFLLCTWCKLFTLTDTLQCELLHCPAFACIVSVSEMNI